MADFDGTQHRNITFSRLVVVLRKWQLISYLLHVQKSFTPNSRHRIRKRVLVSRRVCFLSDSAAVADVSKSLGGNSSRRRPRDQCACKPRFRNDQPRCESVFVVAAPGSPSLFARNVGAAETEREISISQHLRLCERPSGGWEMVVRIVDDMPEA